VSGIKISKKTESDGRNPSFGVYATQETFRRTTRSVGGKVGRLFGFARGDVTLATFPIQASITAASASEQPGQGELLAELLRSGVIDERTAVILHLVVERTRGAGSPLKPYISLLPASFSTPLFWDEEDLGWLRGTTLHKAVM